MRKGTDDWDTTMNLWISKENQELSGYSTTFDLQSLCEWGNCIVHTIEWGGSLLRFEISNLGPLDHSIWDEFDQQYEGETDMYWNNYGRQIVSSEGYGQNIPKFGYDESFGFPQNVKDIMMIM